MLGKSTQYSTSCLFFCVIHLNADKHSPASSARSTKRWDLLDSVKKISSELTLSGEKAIIFAYP